MGKLLESNNIYESLKYYPLIHVFMIDSEDMDVLDEIENSKRKRPELAKFLSRQDMDSYELEDLMLSDYQEE